MPVEPRHGQLLHHMKLCEQRHPDCGRQSGNRWIFWGGKIGDMQLYAQCPYFAGVTIHRTMSRTVAQLEDGSWHELRDANASRCCAYHERLVEILKVAALPSTRQTSKYTYLPRHDGTMDPEARAFLRARAIAKTKQLITNI